MKKLPRGVHRIDPDPFKVFVSATVYWKAATALGRELRLPEPYDTPIFVIEAFSLELHLKCLLRVEGKLLPREHEPKKLLKALDPPSRKLIREYSGKSVAEVNAVMDRCTGIFAKMRYQHEGWKWPKVKIQGAFVNEGVNDIVKAIRKIVKERKPRWDDRKNALLGLKTAIHARA
jgi:hypothetical protein